MDSRQDLVKRQTAVKNWISHFLHHETWEDRSGLWTAKGLKRLRSLKLSASNRMVLDIKLAALEEIGALLSRVEAEMQKVYEQWPQADLDVPRLRGALDAVALPLCAFQTGGTYATRGNCISTADEAVRGRTIRLVERHIDFAATFEPAVNGHARIVFGSLQGARREEPDHNAGETRIVQALERVTQYATERGVTIAFEPVCHGEIGWHNTIASAASLVRRIDQPGLRLMVDSFHMNIEERDLLAPLSGVADVLVHVHLSETNRDVLGEGRWPTGEFLRELTRVGYAGFCSIGVYNARRPRRECIMRCMSFLRDLAAK